MQAGQLPASSLLAAHRRARLFAVPTRSDPRAPGRPVLCLPTDLRTSVPMLWDYIAEKRLLKLPHKTSVNLNGWGGMLEGKFPAVVLSVMTSYSGRESLDGYQAVPMLSRMRVFCEEMVRASRGAALLVVTNGSHAGAVKIFGEKLEALHKHTSCKVGFADGWAAGVQRGG